MRGKLIFMVISVCVAMSSCGMKSDELNSTELQSTERINVTVLNNFEISELIEDTSINQIEIKDISEDMFVNVKEYIPEIIIDLRYATDNNFTGQKIYDFSNAYLRYGTVQKLIKVQKALQEQGLSLKIWDAFRPVAAQFVLWEIYPDSTYVANPNKGFSSHSRGNTVDITVVNTTNKEIVMPTGFDDFSELADRDYSDCSEEAATNALLLEQLMIENGFKAYSAEWWHYTDLEEYPVEEEFYPTS